jgi:hypothetical protein
VEIAKAYRHGGPERADATADELNADVAKEDEELKLSPTSPADTRPAV